MRWLVLLMLLPLAGAQIVIQDPAGDGGYHIGYPPVAQPVEAGSGAMLDLLSLKAWQEGPMLVVEVEQAAPLRESNPEPYVDLSIAGVDLELHYWTWNPFDDGLFPAYLNHVDQQLRLSGYADEQRRVWGVQIPVYDLIRLGIEVVDGDLVHVLGASGASQWIQDGATKEYNGEFDHVPDGLDSDASFPLSLPEKSVGGLSMRSPTPMRASNGAASVFVYDVHVTNDGETAAEVVFTADDVPQGWQVVVPAGLRMEAQTSAVTAVLVALPSRHVHGEAESLLVHAEAGTDRWAETRLGIHFPVVPEPSGHHPRVNVGIADAVDIPPEGMDPYFGNLGFLSLTTLDVDTEGEPVAPSVRRAPWRWSAATESMSLGIDTDLAREGLFEAAFVSPVGMEDVDLEVVVTFEAGRGDAPNGGTVAEGHVQIGTLPRDERVDVAVPLVPHPEGDLIAAGADGKLRLVLTMDGKRVISTSDDDALPHLAPGATMLLPLLEYHDPVEQRFGRGDELDLAGNTTRRMVPEGVGIFSVTVTNDGDASHALTVQTISTVAEPRLLGPSSFRLGAGETREILVAMDAPSAGQADAVLLVSSRDDAEQRQALLLRAIVDPQGVDDTAREPDLVHGEKESPTLTWTLAAAGLLALARRRGA